MVVALPNSNDTHLAVMYQDFNVSANSDLEVLFTCFVMSWNDSSTDVIHRMNNPSFQIMYDDILVFSMEAAIANNQSHNDYTMNEWNQFRLFSR